MAQAGENHPEAIPFHQIGRLPSPGDNVAIAGRTLLAGTQIAYGRAQLRLDHTVLEGHRFAVRPLRSGEPLLSWGLPFGVALSPIRPGDYACNASMIEALRERTIDFQIPDRPNFRDHVPSYALDETRFRPGRQVSPYEESRSFMGYYRGKERGAGTRNMIVILGTTSRTAAYARRLESRMQGVSDLWPNLDGIVAVSHTEGSGDEPLNNREFLLRTLAGLMVHPNVGAVLAVDDGPDQVTNAILRQYLIEHAYPVESVRHHFMTLSGDFERDLAAGEAILRDWLEEVNRFTRTSLSLSSLNLALQCGGSDAFSGVSGNPLAAAVAREIIRFQGKASLAETDELIGAESYILQNVRDLETAATFLNFIARFKERLSWHGATAEGNPSGGNRYRGLYNIVLKSIGAAMKRHPEVRLDYAIDYAQRMTVPGFYFMNTPGNDLESIAGQVAGGSNLILFVTGNGSITNFPLVPTIKIMTTTSRYRMLTAEMDVNAGAYQDGVPMADLAADTLDLVVDVASGRRSAGEKAGHAQVSIWRNWRQRDTSQVGRLVTRHEPSGQPIPVRAAAKMDGTFRFAAIKTGRGYATEQVGLILPTSLCSGQIARMAAEHLNRPGVATHSRLSRYVALAHTEGCGVAVRGTADVYDRTLINMMIHPRVGYGLFLEHGCEKTHNDYMRHRLRERGIDPGKFGWASIQMDGGIQQVLRKIEAQFKDALAAAADPVLELVGLEQLRLGLVSAGEISEPLARTLAQLALAITDAGGVVVLPYPDGLMELVAFTAETFEAPPESASLAYAQRPQASGFHLMETQSRHWVESLTGLAATGVELILAAVTGRGMQGHPLVPLIQLTDQEPAETAGMPGFDLVLKGERQRWHSQVLDLISRVAAGLYTPSIIKQGNVDFQITRGLLGIST